MCDIKIYENPEFGAVRTFVIEGAPHFSGKDVAEALGYTNPQKALRDHVDSEDKTVNESFTVNGTMGILINESGLYSLVLSSKLPNAKKFKRWITNEVLPAIRKHGVYAVDEFLENPDMLIAALTELKAEREHRVMLEHTVAPHLLYPQFMDDNDLAERHLATHTINYVLLGKCRELWAFGDVITEGMEYEINLAKRWQKNIRYFSGELKEVRR